jgi:hypothetical protein
MKIRTSKRRLEYMDWKRSCKNMAMEKNLDLFA